MWKMERTSWRPFATIVALGLVAGVLLPGLAAAEGALAVGLPRDVTKDGIALGYSNNAATADEAREQALTKCRAVKDSTDVARGLCRIVSNYHDQCVAGAEDPEAGTPGVGWAVAPDKDTAEQQALAMCQTKSPPARRTACKVMTSGCDGAAK
jgi:Domain of unknown function (DUF4189)